MVAPITNMNVLTCGRAQSAAQSHVDRRVGYGKAQLLLEQTITRSCGWLFFYQSTEFLLTRDPMAILLGAQPVFVDRVDGHVTEKDRHETVEQFLERYERSVTKQQARP